MISEIKSERIPIKLWLDDVDEGTLEQVKNLANLPFAFSHVALMPDAHIGFGMPIGGVLATKNVIIPNAVGVDIGCGMCAVKTNLDHIYKDELKKIMGKIRLDVPVGFNHHKKAQSENLMPDTSKLHNDSIALKEYNSALKQIGTLGGGNHFIEIQSDDEGFIWIMIHSGSRNIGKTVADFYNKLAININQENNSLVPLNWQLAYLDSESSEGQQYLNEMQFCVDFALANRKLMMQRIQERFLEFNGNIKFDELINIPHNYAALEEHFGEKVFVHRKGATKANQNLIGIIPGSQGTKSYIVKGKGHSSSFESCSHGAGRIHSRTRAQKLLDLNEEIRKMDAKGIIHGIRHTKDLDEAPGAYKNIDLVMANQTELVEIVTELKPLAVIKG